MSLMGAVIFWMEFAISIPMPCTFYVHKQIYSFFRLRLKTLFVPFVYFISYCMRNFQRNIVMLCSFILNAKKIKEKRDRGRERDKKKHR